MRLSFYVSVLIGFPPSVRYAQVLARLAVDEPGENWVGEEYSWSYAQRYEEAG